nr:transposase [Streptomyces sp. NRRL F-2664]
MREFIDANLEWLAVFQLPTYAPDLNPTEGVWSLVRRVTRNAGCPCPTRPGG